MVKFNKTLLLTASTLGLASLFAGSAQAGSITGASVSGSSLTYCSDGTNTFTGGCTLDEALAGDLASPGGNIELNAVSETGDGIGTATTLTGDLNGTNITLSSLTTSDWYDGEAPAAWALSWYAAMIEEATGGALVGHTASFGMFAGQGGLNRFSDPNVSYVNQDETSGVVSIGLAGHLDASAMIKAAIPSMALMVADSVQISEIVKYTYDGVTDYLWSFSAEDSGQVESSDGVSHSGTYEVAFEGKLPPSESVPEPATALGLMAVGALAAARKRS